MLNKPSILLVDDSPDTREALQILLADEAFLFMSVGSGEEALQLLRKGFQFSLVLLDLSIDGSDGLSLLEQMRSITPIDNSKVVLFSANSATKEIANKNHIGFVCKPFKFSELLDLIRSKI